MPETIAKLTLTAEASDVARGDAKLAGETETIISIDRKPVQFECNASPRKECYRIVHDTKVVLALFRSAGITQTRNELFCGTKEECDSEIIRIGLVKPPINRNAMPPPVTLRSGITST